MASDFLFSEIFISESRIKVVDYSTKRCAMSSYYHVFSFIILQYLFLCSDIS